MCPPDGRPAKIAPSLCDDNAAVSGEPGVHHNKADGANRANDIDGTTGLVNPTVLPVAILRRFHFTFLIRHPRRAIPSYFRCTVPPLDKVTGFSNFLPSEAGYDELRRLFDFLKDKDIVGPAMAGEPNGVGDHVSITVIDADDLLDNPEKVIQAYCKEVGLDYTPDMLHWGDEENQKYAAKAFEKWHGFHNDVLASKCLKPRTHSAKNVTAESEDEEWRQKYGEEAQKVIRECVNANIPHYEHLKSFALEI